MMLLESLTLAQILTPKQDPTPPPQPPAIVLQIEEEKKPIKYVVKRGDTLTKIAKKYKTSAKRLYAKNKNIKHQDQLNVGAVLIIPEKGDKLRYRPFKNSVGSFDGIDSKTSQKPLNVRHAKGSAPAGWYPSGQCTWWVWTKRPVGMWGNATDWLWQAKRDGYLTGLTPRPGAIGWTSGHVVYVEQVKGNQVQISEANYDWNGSVRTIWVSASKYTYIY